MSGKSKAKYTFQKKRIVQTEVDNARDELQKARDELNLFKAEPQVPSFYGGSQKLYIPPSSNKWRREQLNSYLAKLETQRAESV